MRKLEDDLGVQLYDRSSRRAVLTPAGREIMQEGRRILRAVSELQERARYIDGGWEQEFSIALDHLLPLRLILPALKEFGRAAPQVRVIIIRETQEDIWDALARRRADLAIGTGIVRPPPGEGQLHHIGELEMVCVAAPQHPLAASKNELTQDTLRAHCYIAADATAGSEQPTVPGIQDVGVALSLVDLRDKLEALRAGLGFGLIPAPLARTEIAAHRLIELRGIQHAERLTVQFATRRRAQGKALEWFVGAMRESGQSWLAKAFE